jgi:hypothetical protein
MTIRHRRMTTAHTRQRRKEKGIEIEWSSEFVRFGTLQALVWRQDGTAGRSSAGRLEPNPSAGSAAEEESAAKTTSP